MSLSAFISKGIYKQFVGHRCDLAPGLAYFSYVDFEGLVKDERVFTNRYNEKLSGGLYYYPDKLKYSDQLVVFLHGYGGGHQAYIKEIEFLCANGYKVLSFDEAGSCNSEGENIRSFHQLLSDTIDIMTFLKEHGELEGLRIKFAGHSMGAYSSLLYSGLDSSVEKVVAISAPVSFYYAALIQIKNEFITKGVFENELKTSGKLGKLSVIDTLKNNTTTKYLLVHSKDDDTCGFKDTIDNVQANVDNPNIEYLIVDGKKHHPTYSYDSCKELELYLASISKKSVEIKNEMAKKADWHKIYNLDQEVMSKIVEFLND